MKNDSFTEAVEIDELTSEFAAWVKKNEGKIKKILGGKWKTSTIIHNLENKTLSFVLNL